LGFVRRIFVHAEYTFIDFDSVADAEKAIPLLNTTIVAGKWLLAQFGKPPPSGDASKLTIPLVDVLPPDHEFWLELAEKLQA
jgi:hypothetical protein